MDISIILPTRGRPAALRRSLNTLQCNAVDPSCFEILLALDDDDSQTLDDLEQDPITDCRAIVGPQVGYVNLHRYVNELCQRARGEWLFLWNDDALMQTPGWDKIVRAFNGQFLLLNPDSNHNNQAVGMNPFPLLPRTWFETLGHVALSNHYDTWIEIAATQLGIMRDIPVRILHDRFDITGNNDDQTARGRVLTTSTFYGEEIQGLIRRDVTRLREKFPSAVG